MNRTSRQPPLARRALGVRCSDDPKQGDPRPMTTPAGWVAREAGGFAAMSLDTVRAAFRRPVQWREFVQQLWFVASVSILPTCLVAIPFGAIIALQTGALIRQLGAVSLNGGASVVAVVPEASPVLPPPVIARAPRPPVP